MLLIFIPVTDRNLIGITDFFYQGEAQSKGTAFPCVPGKSFKQLLFIEIKRGTIIADHHTLFADLDMDFALIHVMDNCIF